MNAAETNDMIILDARKAQIRHADADRTVMMACEKKSIAGAVSQRACVFCGSRVVLYPIADALHLVHGPIGCAAYTWDIRGALSSGPQLHRMSFCTDLREMDIIAGGEKKLYESLIELITRYSPKAAFVYSTCVVGIIGDDVSAICKMVSAKTGIPVLAVHSEGFRGTKKDGYKAACDAIAALMEKNTAVTPSKHGINILGDFNIAGETWIIKEYYRSMGIDVIASITGDGRIDDIRRAHQASLNVVQCSGSMVHLAEYMKKAYGIPYIRVSYFGIEDTAKALYDVATFFAIPEIVTAAQQLVKKEIGAITPEINAIKKDLTGKKAAVYVGGAFKAFSLIKSLHNLGMETVIVGSQTGNRADYERLGKMSPPGTIIVDDATTVELARFCVEKEVDLFIGGVKERPIAYKLGIGFCDHNHERKTPLSGFTGMLNFAREVHATVTSPIWRFIPRRISGGGRYDNP